MNSTQQEIQEFEGEYADKVIEIYAVTGDRDFYGHKPQKGRLFYYSISLIAFCGKNGVIHDKYAVVYKKAAEKDMDVIKTQMGAHGIYKIKVRKSKRKPDPCQADTPDFLLVEILETNAQHKGLQKILDEVLKPKLWHDEVLGNFAWNRWSNHYEKEFDWMARKRKVGVILDEKKKGEIAKAAIFARELLKNQAKWDKKARDYALKNEHWVRGMTEEEFQAKIRLEYIYVGAGGGIVFWFVDCHNDWILSGHTLSLHGSLTEGFFESDVFG